MLHITVECDYRAPQDHDLAGPTVVVGRDEGLDLKLQHEDGASRRHCQLTVVGRELYVEDLGSSNGTKVNGKKIDRRVAVQPGDVIGVGKVRLKAAITGAATRPAVAAAATAAAARAPVARPAAVVATPGPVVRAGERPAPARVTARSEAPRAAARAETPRVAARAETPRVVARTEAAREPVSEDTDDAPAVRDAGPRDAALHDENEACRAELDPLMRRWRELDRPPWALLYGPQLARGLRWMQSDRRLKPRPSEHFREYILASRRYRRERIQQLCTWTGAVALTLTAGSLTAHAVHHEITLGVNGDGDAIGDAQRCSRDPETLRHSNELAKLATTQSDAELAVLVATRALAAAEGACARHGAAEEVLRAQLARQRSHALAYQTAAFRDIDVARDDSTIVTVDVEGAVTLRPTSGAGGSFTLPAGTSKATLAVLSPSDGVLAVGTASGGLELWNVAQTSKPVQIKLLDDHRDEITALSFSDDGRWLASADRRGVIRTWDMRGRDAGTALGELREHRSPVTRLLFRNGGQRLYSLGGQALAWDLDDGRRKGKPLRLAMPGDVTAIVVDNVGNEVFTGDQFGEVLRWKIRNITSASSEKVVKLDGAVVALAYLAKDRALITLGQAKQLRVTEVDKKMRVDSLPSSLDLQGLPEAPLNMIVDPNGRWVAVGAADGKIYVWNFPRRMISAQPVATLDEHRDTVRDLATARDGQWLLSAGGDGTLRRWEMQNTGAGAGSYAAADHEGAVFELSLSADGSRLLSGGQDKRLRLWQIDPSGDPRLRASRDLDAPIKALAISSDGRWGAVGVERQLKVFDLSVASEDRKSLPLERAHHGEVISQIGFSADRGWMVSADDAGVVNTWRMRDDGPEDTPSHTANTASPVTALALAPDSSLVAIGSLDNLVRAWAMNGSMNTPVLEVARHDAAVLSLTFSPNSEYLASGGEDARALLRRNQDGRLEADAEHASFPHERRIQGLAFSPDRRWLATGSDDGMIRVWNLEQGKVKQKDLTGHEGPIVALAFDITSEVLVSASQDKTLRLWRVDDLDLGGEVASIALRGHSDAITALRLDPGGRFAVSAGEDGAIHVWPLKHELLLRLACRVVGRSFTETEWAGLFPGEALVPVCESR